MQLFCIIYYAMSISKQIYSNSNNNHNNTIYNNTYTKNNITGFHQPSYESPYDYKYFALLLLH